MTDLNAVIEQAFPNWGACARMGEHIGPTVETFHEEPDDDRYWLIIVPRCSSCGIPVGADRDPTEAERDAYYRGEREPWLE